MWYVQHDGVTIKSVSNVRMHDDDYEVMVESPNWLEYEIVDGLLIHNDLSTAKLEADRKETRLRSVLNIKVTINNKVFDGDEKSQDRMLRAINIAAITGQTTTRWKLADNSKVEITLEELKEELSLAGQEMSRIWLS